MTDYPGRDPELSGEFSNHAVKRTIQFIREHLAQHVTHAKNVYGNLLHPSELNTLTEKVTQIQEHLTDAGNALGRNPSGEAVHKHVGRAVDAIGELSDMWANRHPELPTQGPHQYRGEGTEELWEDVHHAAKMLYGDVMRSKVGLDPEVL